MNDASSQRANRTAAHPFLVRRATRSDARAISALLKSAFAEFEALYTPEAFVATVQRESGILARLEEGPLWIAERQSAVIGTVAAICLPDSIMVRGMAVDPNARGLGIGKTLLSLIEGFAREHSYVRLSLYTTKFLRRAIHLYQSSGFQFTGETANPHGTELLRMVKVLGGSARTEVAGT